MWPRCKRVKFVIDGRLMSVWIIFEESRESAARCCWAIGWLIFPAVVFTWTVRLKIALASTVSLLSWQFPAAAVNIHLSHVYIVKGRRSPFGRQKKRNAMPGLALHVQTLELTTKMLSRCSVKLLVLDSDALRSSNWPKNKRASRHSC